MEEEEVLVKDHNQRSYVVASLFRRKRWEMSSCHTTPLSSLSCVRRAGYLSASVPGNEMRPLVVSVFSTTPCQRSIEILVKLKYVGSFATSSPGEYVRGHGMRECNGTTELLGRDLEPKAVIAPPHDCSLHCLWHG